MTHRQFSHYVEISKLHQDKLIHHLIVLSIILIFINKGTSKKIKYLKISQEKISVFYCLFPKLNHQ